MVLDERGIASPGEARVTYTVRWHRRSLDVLAGLWVDAPTERAAITEATAFIDRVRQENPQEQGESREGNERVLFAWPLVVSFTVNERRQMVRVVNMRHLRRRGGGGLDQPN